MTGLKVLGGFILAIALVGTVVLAYAVGAWVLGIAIALGIWCCCLYIAFSRSTLRTIVRVEGGGQNRSFQVSAWRHPYWRNWALMGVVLLPVLAVAIPLISFVRSDGLMLTSDAQITPLSATVMASPTHTALSQDAGTEPAKPTETHTALPATNTPAPTPTQPTPSEVPPTDTATPPSPTADQPTSTAREPTPTSTPTPSPSVTPPIETPTASPTWTPSAFPSETPGPIVVQPVPIAPLEGREYKNPVTFSWDGTLYGGQWYRVIVRHIVSGDSVESAALTGQDWTVDLPAHRFGEWRWEVTVENATGIVGSSPEQSFWFNPLPGTRQASPTPTVTPRRTLSP